MPQNEWMIENQVSQPFYNAFRKWAQGVYGWWKVTKEPEFQFTQFQDSPYYQEWIEEGAPGWGTIKSREEIAAGEREERLGPHLVSIPGTTEQGIPVEVLEQGDLEALLAQGGEEHTATSQFGVPTKYISLPPVPEAIESEEERTTREREEAFTQDQLAAQQAETAGQVTATRIAQERWAAEQSEKEEAKRLERWQLANEQKGLAFQAEQQRLMREFGSVENLQSRQFEQWEEWRNRLLGQLAGPANEVARWFVSHKPNPYWSPTGGGEIASLQSLRKAEESGDEAAIAAATQSLEEEEAEVAEKEADYEALVAKAKAGPPTPVWMPGVWPGTTAGEPLGELPPAPTSMSAEKLATILPSQRDWLTGATAWYGGTPWGDIEFRAARESKETNGRVRALAKRWAPAIQRTGAF